MDNQPKTRRETKGSKTKDVFNKKTIRLKEALFIRTAKPKNKEPV